MWKDWFRRQGLRIRRRHDAVNAERFAVSGHRSAVLARLFARRTRSQRRAF